MAVKIKLTLLTFLMLLSSSALFSQVDADTKGREFYFAFMPNFHHGDNNWGRYDSLYVFITSDKKTQGSIEYTNLYGFTNTVNFTINNPGDIYTFRVHYRDIELMGFNNAGIDWDNYQTETVINQSFHITSDDDITVYALSQAVYSSDAFLVYPVDALGTHHFILSYNSDFPPGSMLSATPSQFLIVAPEDNTEVTIKPSHATYRNGTNIQKINLNKGDCYLVQSLITYSDISGDLTGSEITSDKPVAVFGGHQRAAIPDNTGASSRDFIASQIPPVQSWGKEAFILPFEKANNNDFFNDRFRILAAYDGTIVKSGNTVLATLDKGSFYEGNVSPMLLNSNKPILVAEYKATANINQGIHLTGDPFMVIMPPFEQLDNSHYVINAQVYQDQNRTFTKQYITVVAKKTYYGSVSVDGNYVSPALFNSIPNSDYVYAGINIYDGTHHILCDSSIGVVVYGYGRANSYGYTGGMKLDPVITKTAVIQQNTECFKAWGSIKDTANNAVSLTIDPDKAVNVKNSINKINEYSYEYQAELDDFRLDGQFTVTMGNSLGYEKVYTVSLPGFTIAFTDSSGNSYYRKISDTLVTEQQKCYDFELINYGRYDWEIDQIRNYNPAFSIDDPGPFTLKPGESHKFSLCFTYNESGFYSDSVFLVTKCGDFKFIDAFMKAGKDENPPDILTAADSCSILFRYVAIDSTKIDVGIKEVKILKMVNCKADYKFNAKSMPITINVLDPYRDAEFEIAVYDSSGNVSYINKVIPGFTLELNRGISHLDFPERFIGETNCDTIELYNYGKFRMILNNIRLFKNTNFSIPQSQFPLIIEPQSKNNVIICLRAPDSDVTYNDSLLINFNCLNMGMSVSGTASPFTLNGNTRCEIPAALKVTSVSDNFFISAVYPNPSDGKMNFVYNLPEKTRVKTGVYDILGGEVFSKSEQFDKGLHEFTLDISDMPDGVYLLMISSGTVTTRQKIIISR